MDNCLFLCGECAEESFLRRFPVPIPAGEPYTLKDFALEDMAGRSFLVPREGAETAGLLCPASDDLLWAMDQWKRVPLLRRERLKDTEIFLYLLNATELPSAPEPAPSLDSFCRQLERSELGNCDVHLMFPCSFEDADEELFQDVTADVITTRFMKQLERTSREEFSGSDLFLEHRALGIYPFFVDLPKATQEENTQYGFLYLSLHRNTRSGSINLVLPSTALSALWILNHFCGNMLDILDSGTRKRLTEWLPDRWGVRLFGTPRAVLFAFNPLDQSQILKCLAMEPEPIGELIGPTLRRYAQDNIAQYDVAKVYASPKCLVEVERTHIAGLSERLDFECIEIYFVELLLLQTASTRRICQKVLSYMNSEEVLSGEKNYDHLLALSNEMSSAMLFFDYNYFLFPTVSLACQKISKRFGMDEELKKYQEYRAILEQMIDLAQEEREKIESDNMNLLLLILTLVQVLPTLIETFEMLLTGAWSAAILLSWAMSIGVCIALCGLFSLYKHHQLSRAKRRHKRRI